MDATGTIPAKSYRIVLLFGLGWASILPGFAGELPEGGELMLTEPAAGNPVSVVSLKTPPLRTVTLSPELLTPALAGALASQANQLWDKLLDRPAANMESLIKEAEHPVGPGSSAEAVDQARAAQILLHAVGDRNSLAVNRETLASKLDAETLRKLQNAARIIQNDQTKKPIFERAQKALGGLKDIINSPLAGVKLAAAYDNKAEEPASVAAAAPEISVADGVANSVVRSRSGDSHKESSSDELRPGDIVDGWKLTERVGRGGFSQVWAATKDGFEKEVVLKISTHQDGAKYLRREIQFWGLQGKDSILVASNLEGPRPHIVLEHIRDKTLRAILQEAKAKFLPRQSIAIMKKLLVELARLHELGIIHRDIKPDNVMIGKRARIIDFGLARLKGEKLGKEDMQEVQFSMTAMTQEGVMGTPNYVAPEQADPNRLHEVSPASDIFSAAATLWEMTEKDSGDSAHDEALYLKLSRAMAKDEANNPLKRHQNAREMLAALETAERAARKEALEAERKAAQASEGTFSWILRRLKRLLGLEKEDKEAETVVASAGASVMASVGTQAQARGGGSGGLTPADAFDESKMGIAARFVTIEPGEVEMGSPTDEEGRYNDEIRHMAKLTHRIEVAATAVTQLQFLAGTGRNPSQFKDKQHSDGDYREMHGVGLNTHHPVENVTWFDAVEYANAMSKVKGLKPCYNIVRNADGSVKEVKVNAPSVYECEGYRLLTEAEGEYVARAGTPPGFPYWFGYNNNNELDNYAWHAGNSGGRTHAVGKFRKNPFDVHIEGNVWEWRHDFYGKYSGKAETDPEGPATGSRRVARGGSWNDGARLLRSARRGNLVPGGRSDDLGFRLARSILDP